MAKTPRYRHGLAHYRPRVAASAGKPKRGPRRVRSRRLPGPTTNAAHRLWTWALGPIASWPAEARAMKDAALSESLGRPGYEGSLDLWESYQDAHYRRRYRAQQAARPRPAKKPGAWIKVRAHKRRRPGGHR